MPQGDFATASFEQVWTAGLEDEVNSGIAYVEEAENYHIVAIPFLASHSPYGCLVYVFPNQDSSVCHSLHEYASENVAVQALDVAHTFASVTQAVAQNSEGLKDPPEVIINQHIGGFEETKGVFFKTTALQTHFHIFAREEAIIRNHPDLYTPTEPPEKYGEKYLYNDPFLRLTQSIFKQYFPDLESIGNGGLHIGSYKQGDSKTITKDWRLLTEAWYKEWHEAAAIFSDFTHDPNARYAIRPKHDINARLEGYVHDLRSRGIQTSGATALNGLARFIKPSTVVDMEQWFYRGPAGLMSLQYGDTSSANFDIYPRVRTTIDKSAAQMHGFRTLKDTDTLASPDSVTKVQTILRTIIEEAFSVRKSVHAATL